MPSIHAPFVSIALSRLRRGVSLCCWMISLALITQLLIWCIATFMDVRHEMLPDKAATSLIVSANEAAKQAMTPAAMMPLNDGAVGAGGEAAPEVNRVWTKQDRIMARASMLALGAGTLAMIVVLPLLMLGAMLAAGSATPGVERAVSAFMWSLLVALLVLPIGEMLGLPWHDGALMPYEHMTRQVDLVMGAGMNSWGGLTFYARFAVLPLACLVGVIMVGLRFSFGVSAGILPKEDMRLDPALEREAGNITPGSLHAGRAGAALKAASAATVAERKPVAASSASATQLSVGDAPKRLI